MKLTYADLPLIAVDTATYKWMKDKIIPTGSYEGERQSGEFGSDGRFRYYDYEEANRQSVQWSEKYIKKVYGKNTI